MRKVLIVDDDKELLEDLKAELSKDRNLYRVEFAHDGAEALKKLKKEDYDLVITDIKMPAMDGVQLITEILNCGKWTHVLVASGETTMRMMSMDKMRQMQRFGVLNYIFKPYLPSSLRKIIRETLAKIDQADTITGISLPTVLQMMELEAKTGVLRVKSGGKHGALFFTRGTLVDAVTGTKTGLDAAIEILTWDNVQLRIEYVPHHRERTIKNSIAFLVLEAARKRDEK